MGIAIRKFYHEVGQEAATVTEIKTALAAAGWVQTTSDGKELYRTALPGVSGNYAYVYLTADDGNGKIGLSVGGQVGSDFNGLSYDKFQVLSKSCQNTAGYHTVWASERWFLVYPNHMSWSRMLLGAGLIFTFHKSTGDAGLLAIGNQGYNSASTYDESMFDTDGSIVASTILNDAISTPMRGWGQYIAGSGFETMAYAVPGPGVVPFGPVTLARTNNTIGLGPVSALYDAYSPAVEPDRIIGANADTGSFKFNGWIYYCPQHESEQDAYSFFIDGQGGKLFLRGSAV